MSNMSNYDKGLLYFKGKVVHGFGRGSKALGCATSNLDIEITNNIRDGVWVATAKLKDINYKAAVSIGNSPYYGDLEKRIMEVHLIGYKGDDFYDEIIEVSLIKWLRDQRTDFKSEDELKKCIKNDIICIEEYFKKIKNEQMNK